MIKVEIVEQPNETNPLKKILFINSSGGVFRSAYYDKHGVPVLEELQEYDVNKSGIQSTSILVGADYKLVAYRKYLRSRDIEGGSRSSEEYKLVDGDSKLINRAIYEYLDPNDRLNVKKTMYDAKNDPCYISISKRGEKTKFYCINGEEVDFMYVDQNLINFENIDDIMLQYLDEAVKRLSNK